MGPSIRALDCLLAGGAGFLLGAYYELFRLWRLWTRPGRARVFWQDIFYSVTGTAAFFLFLLAVADGRVRLWLIVCAAAGWIAWHATVGRVIYAAAGRIGRTLRAVRRRWSSFYRREEEKLQKILAKPVIFLKKRLQNAIHLLYNSIMSHNLTDLNGKGELPDESDQGGRAS